MICKPWMVELRYYGSLLGMYFFRTQGEGFDFQDDVKGENGRKATTPRLARVIAESHEKEQLKQAVTEILLERGCIDAGSETVVR